MTKLFSSFLFSFFLLFQTIGIAEEEVAPTEIASEDEDSIEAQSSEGNDENDTQTEMIQEEFGTALSELEKEALAAEEAELRESGAYDEPVEE